MVQILYVYFRALDMHAQQTSVPTFYLSLYIAPYVVYKSNKESVDTIRIHHGCEGRIEESVRRIAVWHHKACRVMTNSDPKGRIYLSYPLTNNGFFFLLTTVYKNNYLFINLSIHFKLSFQKSLNTIRLQFNMMTVLDVLGKITWVRYFFYPRVKSQISLSGEQECCLCN